MGDIFLLLILALFLCESCGINAYYVDPDSITVNLTISNYYSHPNITKKILVGGPVTFSGSSSSYINLGGHTQNTRDMWAWYINEVKGGIDINGELYGVEVISIDDVATKAVAYNVTGYLIDTVGGVDFLVGPYSSGLTGQASAVAEPKQVLMVSGGASSTSVYSGKKYIYGTLTPASEYLAPAIRTLVLRGARKLSMFWEDKIFTETACAAVKDYFTSLSYLASDNETLEIVYEQMVAVDAPDEELTDVVTGIHDTTDGDIHIAVGCTYYDVCTRMVNITKAMGFEPDSMVFTVCVDNPDYTSDLGMDGRYVLGTVQWEESMAHEGTVTGWTAKDFANIYRERYGGTPPYQAASTFAAHLALGIAIERAQTLDSTMVGYEMGRLDVDTFYGTIMFDSNGQNAGEMGFMQYNEDLVSKIVLPDSVATGPLIHPMPSWSYRECIATYGPDSCKCSEEGCPACIYEDYDYELTECFPSTLKRHIIFSLKPDTDCEGGLSTPESITNIDCDHVPLNSPIGGASVFLAVLGGFVGFIFMVYVIIKRKNKIIRNSQPLFCILFCVGGIFLCLSMLLKLGVQTTAKCVSFVWIFHITLTVGFGSLFVKAFRVWRIFGNKKLIKKRMTVTDTLKPLSVMLAVDLILLICWVAAEKPGAKITIEQYAHIAEVPFQQCDKTSLFSGFLKLTKVFLLLIGCYMSYQVRNVGMEYAEAKQIMFAIFSIVIFGGIALIISMVNVSVGGIVLIHTLGATISCVIAFNCIFVPKVLMMVFPSYYEKHGGIGTTAGGTKGGATATNNNSVPSTHAIVVASGSQRKTSLMSMVSKVTELEEENQALKEEISSLKARMKAAEKMEKRDSWDMTLADDNQGNSI
eukprot:CAMPEP_0117787308 /NCGR_PEP_ID=MMETSP0948-20121206/6315_1 /TAXON_ID=44440 /ORGANISM="Chattonella subsalsa, Strain CCMP2191" /LENGTH=865 /DNA_ID=CAMNT_0005616407 /DNA_START=302 /DNA_END=2900 /DNA_ORIENTATION=+